MSYSGIQWGQPFPASLETNNLIDRQCYLSTVGHPVCCSIFDEHPERLPYSQHHHGDLHRCIVEKKYVSSPYEMKQFEIAKSFDRITNSWERQRSTIEYITSAEDLNSSFIWLTQVSNRMKNSTYYENYVDGIDLEFLSRFDVTKICPNVAPVTWTEWIEPISLHARNPLSLLNCMDINKEKLAIEYPRLAHIIHQTSLINADHILLSYPYDNGKHNVKSRNYLFDAGTSTFESSLWWFLCLYQQSNVSFDEIFGWEATLLEPESFWKVVPPAIRSKYHFYNTRMISDIDDGDSPLRMIRQLARVDDFVSFKLDIDAPETEILTSLEILRNPNISQLIDEFFFELHFRCDIMMRCGWGDSMPAVFKGLALSRYHSMELFLNLRKIGIRSHFWP